MNENEEKAKTSHQVLSPNNLKFTLTAREEEIVFIDELAMRLGIEKSNLIRRAIITYLKEIGVAVPNDLFEDRSKGNHNPPTEKLKGARWKDHTPKKKAVKPTPPPPLGTERLYLQSKTETSNVD